MPRIVALRQITSLDEPDAGSRVPFYMQPALGGSAFLRGTRLDLQLGPSF